MPKVGDLVGDIDHGWDRIMKEPLGRSIVKIGIQGSAAGNMREGGITNARLAAVHEYGATIDTGRGIVVIPARSFVRSTMDTNREKYNAAIDKLAGKVLDGALDEKQALGLLGLQVESDMKRTIERGIPPPNAPSTIAAKGSSKPLIDTGELKNSITSTVASAGESKQ